MNHQEADPDPETLPIPSEVKGSPLTTAKNFDPRVKGRALELYLTTDLSIMDLSIELQVPDRVLARWAQEDNWLARKQKLEAEYMARAENSYRRFVAEKRTNVAVRHLEVASKLEDAIHKIVNESMKDGGDMMTEANIKRLAEALSSVTGVSARAVGLGTGVGNGQADSGQGGQGQGKRPLVMIGINGVPTPSATINVTSDEVD